MRFTSSFIPATQLQVNCYSEYQPSQQRDAASAVQEPAAGYTQADVEQWVHQQNASRQKQQQMASSSVYPSHLYGPYDQIPESECYRYWPEHRKPVSAVGLAGVNNSSSVDFIGPSGYGNMDAAMNVHSFCHENCRIPDDSLTLEQRQQRQSKIGRLEVIRQMLNTEQQAPMCEERLDHMRGASVHQGQVAPNIGWNCVPYGCDVYAGQCNSGSEVLSAGYDSSTMRHRCRAPNWHMATTAQHRWYDVQPEHYVNTVRMPNRFHQHQSTDFCTSNMRYFGPRNPSPSDAETYKLSVRDGVMPVHAMCDCSSVYPLQACMCEGGMSSHMSRHSMRHSGMCRYTDVGMQSSYGSQEQMNKYSKFVNGGYVVPVSTSRQPTYIIPCKRRADSMPSVSAGEDVVKQRLMAAPAAHQFDAHGQQITLPYQPNNSSAANEKILAKPATTPVSCVPAYMPRAAIRQKLYSSKKKNSSLAARSVDSKSSKLDSAGEWSSPMSATRSGTLMNITSESLAHLAKGVENIAAVMQQTVQQGGPFQSVQGTDDCAEGSDENANFIRAGNSLQIQASGVLDPNARQVGCASVCTSNIDVCASVTSPQTAASSGVCFTSTVPTFNPVSSNGSTTGVDVVVMSKAPYTISYHPANVSSDHSHSNIDNLATDDSSVKMPSNHSVVYSSGMALHAASVPMQYRHVAYDISNHNGPNYNSAELHTPNIAANVKNTCQVLGANQQTSRCMAIPVASDNWPLYESSGERMSKSNHRQVPGLKTAPEGSLNGMNGPVTQPYIYSNAFVPASNNCTSSTGLFAGNDSNAAAATVSHNASMAQPAYLALHADTTSAGRMHVLTGESFGQLSQQEICRMTSHKNPAVDQQPAANDSYSSKASALAVIQPQMMSGTQLFVTSQCSESTPVLNNL